MGERRYLYEGEVRLKNNPDSYISPADFGIDLKNVKLGREWEDEEFTEDPRVYTPGRYHRTHLGDGFVRLPDGGFRYTILLRFGLGRYSGTWLARDNVEGGYVALKIYSADIEHIRSEAEVLQRIQSAPPPDSPSGLDGRAAILGTQDSLFHTSPRGIHKCLVMTPTRYDVGECQEGWDYGYHLTLVVARAVTAQVIQAVAYLHSLGIVHGALGPQKVLLKLPDISHLTIEDIYAVFGSPWRVIPVHTEDIETSLNVPRYLVPTSGRARFQQGQHISLKDARVVLGGFGYSWIPASEDRFEVKSGNGFNPPEAIPPIQETDPLSFPVDMWALGCLAYFFFSDRGIFEFRHLNEKLLRREIAAVIGEAPLTPLSGVSEDEDDSSAFTDDATLETRLGYLLTENRVGDMSEEEHSDLRQLIESLLKRDPKDRATAAEVLEGPWMRKWGLPAVNRMKLLPPTLPVVPD